MSGSDPHQDTNPNAVNNDLDSHSQQSASFVVVDNGVGVGGVGESDTSRIVIESSQEVESDQILGDSLNALKTDREDGSNLEMQSERQVNEGGTGPVVDVVENGGPIIDNGLAHHPHEITTGPVVTAEGMQFLVRRSQGLNVKRFCILNP